KVLVTGGYNGNSAAELYDPLTGNWTMTGNMTALRSYHTISKLTNGTILVAGGVRNSTMCLKSAELY
ncbi:unnamed protein product, partial [Adineta steineri]